MESLPKRHGDCIESRRRIPLGLPVTTQNRCRKATIMTRLNLVDPKTAQGRTKELFDSVQKKLGLVPNLTRGLANSPAALDAYLAFGGALAAASLSPKTREQIALTVGEVNACGYCLSAHTLLGQKLGLSEDDVHAARRATSSDPKTAAILRLAKDIVVKRGELKDADLRQAREAGITDGELAEIVAVVSLNIFTNYFNHIAATAIDFPEVKPGLAAAALVSGDTCSTEGSCSN